MLLLRHGETALNALRCFVGSTDLPLSAKGRRQAAAAARWVRAYDPVCCFTSPLRRCVETGKIVLGRSAVQTQILPDLREIDFGAWEGKNFAQVQTAYSSAVRRWLKFDMTFRIPGGERLGDFVARVRRAATQIAASPAPATLVVTHGGVIRSLICQFLGLPMRHYAVFVPSVASLTAIDLFPSGKAVLTGLVPGDRPLGSRNGARNK